MSRSKFGTRSSRFTILGAALAVGLASGCSSQADKHGATKAAVTGSAGSASLSYDSLGRLIQITYDNGTTIAYTYDAAGNRTGAVVTCGTTGC